MPKTHKQMRGFQYLLFSMFSSVLLFVLVLLPLNPVFADEVVDGGESTPSEPVVETMPEEKTEELQTEPEDSNTDVPDDQNSDPVTEEEQTQDDMRAVLDDTVREGDDISNVETQEQEAVTTQTVTSPPTDIASADAVLFEDAASATPGDVIDDGNVLGDPLGSFDDSTTGISDNSHEESVSTTTFDSATHTPLSIDDIGTEPQETLIDTPQPPNQEEDVTDTILASSTSAVTPGMVINDQNRFIFSKDECVRTGDGAFYCTESESAPALMNSDRIFSALDEDGDKEIFIERSGVITPITQNNVDDDGPYYDEVSDTAVWHRLIDGRHQIVSYNFKEDAETILTTEHYNNMQPNRFGEIVVWQGWVGEDWEVFIDDGKERTMLTDNTTHDILPTVNGDHIVWQSFEGDAWKVKVYDRRTGITDTIENADGGSVQNPRFVLVYDTETVEGDIQTKGYDLRSGDVIELGSRPAQVPEKLPDPEQTGEERALVTPSIQPKNKLSGNEEDDLDDTGIDLDSDFIGETGSTTETLIIPPYEVGNATTSESTNMLSPEDLIISPSDDPSYEHIEDVVVTPFGTTSDSQLPIAE